MADDLEEIRRRVHIGHCCARCIADLPASPTLAKGKRFCTPCAARNLREIVANVMRSHDGYSVHCLEADCRTPVGPWLILDAAAQVLTLLTRGNITDADLEEFQQELRSWGQTSVYLWLDPKQYDKLVADGIRRPWNGYEERRRQGKG